MTDTKLVSSDRRKLIQAAAAGAGAAALFGGVSGAWTSRRSRVAGAFGRGLTPPRLFRGSPCVLGEAAGIKLFLPASARYQIDFTDITGICLIFAKILS